MIGKNLHGPTTKEVAEELRRLNANVQCDWEDPDERYCDVRLQVYPNGIWAIRYGLSDYDQDHLGYWGSSTIPGVQRGVVKRFNSREVARDLIKQVKDHYAQTPHCERCERLCRPEEGQNDT